MKRANGECARAHKREEPAAKATLEHQLGQTVLHGRHDGDKLFEGEPLDAVVVARFELELFEEIVQVLRAHGLGPGRVEKVKDVPEPSL